MNSGTVLKEPKKANLLEASTEMRQFYESVKESNSCGSRIVLRRISGNALFFICW
jgi:hypothetical protein